MPRLIGGGNGAPEAPEGKVGQSGLFRALPGAGRVSFGTAAGEAHEIWMAVRWSRQINPAIQDESPPNSGGADAENAGFPGFPPI